MTNKTVTSPKGFKAAGLHCGIKNSGKKDIALLLCPGGATAAAMFTTNKVVSAAVTVCKQHIKNKTLRAVIVNSGNANACTGTRGLADAEKTCNVLARKIDAEADEILVASTGIIGKRLPMPKINAGIKKLTAAADNTAAAGADFAQAIMTTDTKPKQAVRKFVISGKKITIAAAAKGAGMIAPNMATTLCFITTDINITRVLLNSALREAISGSLNKLTVDGHQSTNDTAIILASAAAINPLIKSRCRRYTKFANALAELCTDLVKQMALDAEGATRMFTVIVKGAATKSDAAKAARAVADYDLVKCAVHGAEANWGRIICALGSAAVKIDLEKLSCKIGNITVFRNGQPAVFNAAAVSRVISAKEHTITIDLGRGRYSDFCYGCDLSGEYVKINADYHT